MFASPYFDPARDWREIAIRAHQLLTQTAPDGPEDLALAEAAPEKLRKVA